MVTIIEKHENHKIQDKYKLTCSQCGSIITMETEDFGKTHDLYAGKQQPTFTCPVCERFYNWGYKNDRAAFEEIPEDDSTCLPDKLKIKSEVDKLIDETIVNDEFWAGYAAALETIRKFIDTL